MIPVISCNKSYLRANILLMPVSVTVKTFSYATSGCG